MRMKTEPTKAEALATAAELEAKTTRPHYVVRWFDGTWEITAKMPRAGDNDTISMMRGAIQWFTSDGTRRG